MFILQSTQFLTYPKTSGSSCINIWLELKIPNKFRLPWKIEFEQSDKGYYGVIDLNEFEEAYTEGILRRDKNACK